MAEFNISLTYDADSDSQEYELIVDCKLWILLNLPLLLSLFLLLFFLIEFKSYFIVYYFIFLFHCHKYMMHCFLFLSDIQLFHLFLFIFISGLETATHIRSLSDKCGDCIYMNYAHWCGNSWSYLTWSSQCRERPVNIKLDCIQI